MADTMRAVMTEMPVELIPIYKKLQEMLNKVLSDPNARNALLKIDLSDTGRNRGNVWKEMHNALRSWTDSLDVNNKSWFQRMLYENLRRLLKSLEEKSMIYALLKANKFKIDSALRENLTQAGLYPTNAYLKRMAKSKSAPTLPSTKTFEMDYSISNPAMFKMANGVMQFKVDKKEWVEYEFKTPMSVRKQATGEFSKPRFVITGGKPRGFISYKIAPDSSPGKSIMGVDLGIVKLFSATVIRTSGDLSHEYVPSRRLEGLISRFDRIRNEITLLGDKMARCSNHQKPSNKDLRRLENMNSLHLKSANLKREIAKVSASEIVSIALKEGVGTISLENLSWNESGGLWNYSEQQDAILNAAEPYGISVVHVNAHNTSKEHPISREVGTQRGRLVRFKDGQQFDRDRLAGINLAKRAGAQTTRDQIKKHRTCTPDRSKVIGLRRERKELLSKHLQAARSVEIVTLRPGHLGSNPKSWTLVQFGEQLILPRSTSQFRSKSSRIGLSAHGV